MIGVGGYGKFYLREMEKRTQDPSVILEGVCDVMPEVEKLTRMPDPRIHLETDFNAAETRVSGEVGLSFRIGDLVSIGIAFAGPALKWFRAFRKAQKTQEKQAAREREAAQRNTKDQAPAAADATHTTN